MTETTYVPEITPMNSTRSWNILVWNVRGSNAQSKWDCIRDKISESSASILCLQETKKEFVDASYISKFCPRNMNKFAFSSSDSASGGLLTFWNNNLFDGEVICTNNLSITIKFTSLISRNPFHLT